MTRAIVRILMEAIVAEVQEDKIVRQHLTVKQNHVLNELILAEFTSSGLSLEAFSTMASERLGFRVSKTHISTRIEAWEIPINRPVPAPKPKKNGVNTAMLLAHEQRINDLEEKVKVMQGWINTTFPTYGGKAIK